MKKLHRARDFLAGALVMALALCLIVPAGAALTGKKIDVLQGIEIFVDGVKLEPKDANGKSVETFVYNGTTYVPLRAVSQSLGKNVKWDGANQRVYIGEVPGERQYLLDACPPYQMNNVYTPATVMMAGTKYAHCCTFDFCSAFALFNLNGQYNTLSFDVGHVDDQSMVTGTLNIYLDGTLSYSMDLEPEALPQHCELPLYGALQMKIEVEHGSLYAPYAMANIEVY